MIQVITTCNSDAVNMVQKLGPDVVIDYKLDDADSRIIAEGPYVIQSLIYPTLKNIYF